LCGTLVTAPRNARPGKQWSLGLIIPDASCNQQATLSCDTAIILITTVTGTILKNRQVDPVRPGIESVLMSPGNTIAGPQGAACWYRATTIFV
jgi:hypothetical protein